MTTVCAVARDGVVVMGADSMTNVYDRPVLGAVKVRRHPITDGSGDVVLFGFAGSGALPDLLTANLTIATAPTDCEDPQRWASTTASAVTEIAVEAHLTDDGQMHSNLLLGWGGKLWTITHHQAIPHTDGVAAVGSGEGMAIGAIDYGLARGDNDLTALVTRAVLIGIERDRYSGGSVTVERLG